MEVANKKEEIECPFSEKVKKVLDKRIKKCIFNLDEEKEIIGFFCLIPYGKERITVLITNNEKIDENYIRNNSIIKIIIEGKKKNLVINDGRKYLVNKKYKTTIIEIIPQKDKIYQMLELDQSMFNEQPILSYINTYIIIFDYLSKNNISMSCGLINKIDNYIIHHNCNNYNSGTPILNLLNNRVIGLNINSSDEFGEINSIYLKQPIIEYIKNYYNINNLDLNVALEKNEKFKERNEIRMILKINKEDLNKDIYFLDNSKGHKNLEELSDSNTTVYISDEKYKFIKCFRPKNEGIFIIKIKLAIKLKNCSYMFHNCSNISNLDLSYFDSSFIEKADFMFSQCINLRNINLINFNTRNIESMKAMFYDCNKLQYINLKSFDTINVKNMSFMFGNCNQLPDINLLNFSTYKVEDMSSMFIGCATLKSINLKNFDTRNVTNMSKMFKKCKNLLEVNLTSFETNKVKNMNEMFKECTNLIKLDLRSFEVKDCNISKDMFSDCNKLLEPIITEKADTLFYDDSGLKFNLITKPLKFSEMSYKLSKYIQS